MEMFYIGVGIPFRGPLTAVKKLLYYKGLRLEVWLHTAQVMLDMSTLTLEIPYPYLGTSATL